MRTELILTVKDFLVQKLNPSFIIIFGSHAKGTVHHESDLDIAYYSSKQVVTSYDLFLYAQELADLLKVEVDLVNLAEASTVFQAQIFSTGEVIYCTDEYERMNMQMHAYSMYSKLNEERQPVLKNINESGSVYEERRHFE